MAVTNGQNVDKKIAKAINFPQDTFFKTDSITTDCQALILKKGGVNPLSTLVSVVVIKEGEHNQVLWEPLKIHFGGKTNLLFSAQKQLLELLLKKRIG